MAEVESALKRIAPELRGLNPQAWVCVRDGFSREEVKDELLGTLGAITGQAVCSVEGLAAAVLGVESDRILRADARREILRALIKTRAIAARLPEIQQKSHSGRRARFVARLDRAIAQGRLCFAVDNEWLAQEERLRSVRGKRELRTEIRVLAVAFESWMESQNYWDLPRLLSNATERLRTGPRPTGLPARVYRLGVTPPEPRETFFWEALGAHAEVLDLKEPLLRSEIQQQFEIWHSVDDAAHAAAESWRSDPSGVLLIPDSVEVRRSLRLGLGFVGAVLRDDRDPVGPLCDESIKTGLLPLQVVASGFERRDVQTYLARAAEAGLVPKKELESWAFAMSDAGWSGGWKGAVRGQFPAVSACLSRLNEQLGQRRTVAQFELAHRAELALLGLPGAFFEELWARVRSCLELVGNEQKRIRVREALDRLTLLIEESPPESDGIHDASGAEVYRAQVPRPLGFGSESVTVLGLGAAWLDEGAVGDLWYNEAERQALREFGLNGREEVRARRRASLASWIDGAKRVFWIDYLHDSSGAERELPERLWSEWAPLEPGVIRQIARHGAHRRWQPSLAGAHLTPQRRIELPAADGALKTGERPLFTATQIENISRCGAISLARDRWKVRDLEEAGPEIQAAARGVLLHEAVRRLLRARSQDGRISLTSKDALDQAMTEVRMRGLMQGERVLRVARAQLLMILDAFLAEEAKYFERSQANPISLDEMELIYQAERADIKGRPDRIDEVPQGLFVMDYKSSTSNPKGAEMLELGYRLQLPLYALAAEQVLGRPVLGAQFIPLALDASRKAGVFFSEFNGKDPGKLTATTKANKSLIQQDRAEVWGIFRDHLDRAVEKLLRGDYSARPVFGEQECSRCRYTDFCGQNRDQALGGAILEDDS